MDSLNPSSVKTSNILLVGGVHIFSAMNSPGLYSAHIIHLSVLSLILQASSFGYQCTFGCLYSLDWKMDWDGL